MTRSRSATKLTLVVAAAFLLSACGQTAGGNPAPAADREQPAATGSVSAGVPASGAARPRTILASQDVKIDGYDLRVAIHELARRDRLVELTFSVTRTDSNKDRWQVGQTFGGSQAKSTLSVSGVELLDTVNGKLHTVALDQERNCVCSAETSSTFLEGGDSVLFSATYGAPPESVTTMGVRIPKVGTFNDVALS